MKLAYLRLALAVLIFGSAGSCDSKTAIQPTNLPAPAQPSGSPINGVSAASKDKSQINLTADDLTSYESFCKAIDSSGVLDTTGSSIAGIRKEIWLSGKLFVELTDKNEIFQIRWSTDHKPYFDGNILGMNLNESLDEFQKRFPNFKKVTEIVYEANYDQNWSIVVTAHAGKVLDDITINNNHYSLRATILPER